MLPSNISNSLDALHKLELQTLAESFRNRDSALHATVNRVKWEMFVNGTILRRIQQLLGPRGGYKAFVPELGIAYETALKYSNFARSIHAQLPSIAGLGVADLLEKDVMAKLASDEDFQSSFQEAAQSGLRATISVLNAPALPQAGESADEQPDVAPEERRKQDEQAAVAQSEFLWMKDFLPKVERDILGVGVQRHSLNGSWVLLPRDARAKLADTLMDAARKVRESLKDNTEVIDTVEIV